MDKYTYRVTWSEEDGEYVGLCAEFPSLSWLADTQEAALVGIKDIVNQVIQDMNSSGEPPPTIGNQTLLREVYSSYPASSAQTTPDTSRRSQYKF